MPERPIGKVTHYFSRISVAGVELTEPLAVGDTVRIKGHTTDFTQRVESMEIEHGAIQRAGPAQDVALKVEAPVRQHDTIYKVEP